MKYKRICPNCENEITYSTKHTLQRAINKNSICKKCRRIPELNPFYGKKHTKGTKKKLSEVDKSYMKTKEFTKSVIKGMNGNTNRKPFYDCWVDRYGKEIADSKLKDFRLKQSNNNKGEHNPMFGKPSPQGSGNGWSGWYNGVFFRSRLELSCMVMYDNNNIKYQTMENRKYAIPYTNQEGVERRYYPDLLLDDGTVIEVKPKKLLEIKTNISKFKRAKEIYGNKFKIMTEEDITVLTTEQIKELRENKQLIFTDRYEEKFKKRYLC